MRKSLKKLLSILLAVAMLLGAAPAAASITAKAASSGTCGENLTWKLNSAGTLTISGTGAMTDFFYPLTVPWNKEKIKNAVIDEGVTGIGAYAFYDCRQLVAVSLPETLLQIGEDAFAYCVALSALSLPNGITAIAKEAFYNCSGLEEVDLPNTLESLGRAVFGSCAHIKSIRIPGSVSVVPAYCVTDCIGLETVIMENGVGTIEESAFCNSKSLKTISIPASVTNISLDLTYDDDETFSSLERFIVDENNPVYSNDETGALLKKDTLIAFPRGSAVTEYTVPENVTEVNPYVFSFCRNLEKVNMSKGLTSLGEGAFFNSKALKSIRLPSTIGKIPPICFDTCVSLTDVVIENGITEIGTGAFYGCSALKTIFIPASVTKIPPSAFFCESLVKFEADKNNPVYFTDEAGALFSENDFVAFPPCSPVTDYTIPEGIVQLYSGAFLHCESIAVLRIPASVASINDNGFISCKNLKDIFYNGTEAEWLQISFMRDRMDNTPRAVDYRNSNLRNINVHCLGEEHTWNNGDVMKTATPSADGQISYTCVVCGAEKEPAPILKASKITLSKTRFVYNGKIQKPALTVKDSAGKTISSKYYTAKWSNAKSKAVGKYTVTVTFKGNYSGKKVLTYTIAPKQVTGVKKAASTTKSIKLSWTKATGAKYYQVYAYSGGAWKYVKTVTTNSATVTRINGKALAAGKTYYFKVRALDESKKAVGAFSATLKTGTRTAAPKITALTSPKAKTVKVTWGKVTGAKSYVVYKSTDGKKWVKAGTATGTSFTLNKLTGGKRIYVKVLAVNAYKANSAYSAAKYVTVKK